MTLNGHVKREQAGKRLDQILKDACTESSRAALQKAIRHGFCKVDGEIKTDPALCLRLGQNWTLSQPVAENEITPLAGQLDIVFEDANLAICSKQPGLTVHPCPSCGEPTLVNFLLNRYPHLKEQGNPRPGIAHRLDKDTSGLMLVALDEKTRLALAEAFANRQVKKEYLALVYGEAPEKGSCQLPIGRHPALKIKMAVVPENRGGKPASTTWRRLWLSPDKSLSLLAVKIHTGRTHQIRVHLAHCGLPLLGDKLYAPSPVMALAPRQMLHSWKLAFSHPQNGQQIAFRESPPEDFILTIMNYQKKSPLLVVTGNPGSGKSTFTAFLAKNGWPEISADAIVNKLYSEPGPVCDWLEKRGSHFFKNGLLDKEILFQKLNSDQAFKKEFESYVHKLVFDEINHFWQNNKDAKAVVAEIPLYFECGWDHLFEPAPVVIGVSCDTENRWARLRANRHWDDVKIAAIDSWQWDRDRKMASCDLVVDNNGDEKHLSGEVEKIRTQAMAEYEKRRQKAEDQIRSLWEDDKDWAGENP